MSQRSITLLFHLMSLVSRKLLIIAFLFRNGEVPLLFDTGGANKKENGPGLRLQPLHITISEC